MGEKASTGERVGTAQTMGLASKKEGDYDAYVLTVPAEWIASVEYVGTYG